MAGRSHSRIADRLFLIGAAILAIFAIRSALPPADDATIDAPPAAETAPAPRATASVTPAPVAAPADTGRRASGDAACQGVVGGPVIPAVSADPASWFTPDDYPADAVRRGQEGVVEVDWIAARDGHVSQCRVTRSSGVASLDQASCAVLTARGRYRPARDSRGCPLPTRHHRRIRWQLPVD